MSESAIRKTVVREAAWFVGLLLFGLLLMPVAIYFVGDRIFGDYGGEGYGAFFGALVDRIASGNLVAWFLVSSPYLFFLLLRLTALGWRVTAKPQPSPSGDRSRNL